MSAVLLLDSDFPDRSLEREVARRAGVEFLERAPDDAALVEALLVQWTRVDAAALDRWPNVRVVGRLGLGLDTIDLEECARRGVVVVNSGEYSTEEVATHAVALALSLERRVVSSDADVRSARWIAGVQPDRVRRLSGLTVGVVGLGRIGTKVASIFHNAFGTRVAGFDPYATAVPSFVTRHESLHELLAVSDIVTLHSPLLPSTRGLMGATEFASLKPGAVLVNVARGGLVDQGALIDALMSGRLAGAGLDVFDEEPLPEGSPLLSAPHTVLTPHVGYLSRDALEQARRQVLEDVVAVLAGRDPQHTL